MWWYIGDQIIDRVAAGDTVFTCGFCLHSKSTITDAAPIIRSCELSTFHADDWGVGMRLRGAPENYKHSTRSIQDFVVYSNGILSMVLCDELLQTDNAGHTVRIYSVIEGKRECKLDLVKVGSRGPVSIINGADKQYHAAGFIRLHNYISEA